MFAETLDAQGVPTEAPREILGSSNCGRRSYALAYDSRRGSYLLTWGPERHHTYTRRLAGSGSPQGRAQAVGLVRRVGAPLAAVFNDRRGRYELLSVLQPTELHFSLLLTELGSSGHGIRRGLTIKLPSGFLFESSAMAYASNADHLIIAWAFTNIAGGGDHAIWDQLAQVATGNGARQLRQREKVSAPSASPSLIAYDPRHRRYLFVWETRHVQRAELVPIA